MKDIHVECKPDEMLVRRLGFTKKKITHYPGKSRVFRKLGKSNNQLALVDEDPGSTQTSYEKKLRFLKEAHGIKFYQDKSQNKVFVLKGKLEDWLIQSCKLQNIDISRFTLPDDPEELHDVINQRQVKYNELLDHLLEKKNPALLELKNGLFSSR